jgi:hypothetical protein
MNKLGFYTKNFGAPGVFDAFRDVKPPVLLTELDDKGMLRRIRNELSPGTFVIGRFHFAPGEQDSMLDDPNPVAVGIRLAEQALTHDFHFATQRGDNGRLFVDAWMTLNECIPGPNTDVFKSDPETMKRRVGAYDTMQVAFLNRLRQEIPDVEAVAFNFGAGNLAPETGRMVRIWSNSSPRRWRPTPTWASTSTAGPTWTRMRRMPLAAVATTGRRWRPFTRNSGIGTR